jgi:hypothetical protein
MIGLDVTTSIAPERFVQMRDAMIPQIVLARLQPGDEVQLAPIHANPDRQITVKRLTEKFGTDKKMGDLSQHLRQLTQTKDPKVPNNLGNLLAYAKRIGTTLDSERQRVARQGKASPPAAPIVFQAFTDGELPAGQSLPQSSPWPVTLQVWVWGVENAYEARLKQWLMTDLGLPEEQLQIVRFSEWQTTAEKVFGPRVGRPFPDMGLLKRLGAI